jgi:hypothetical protein
MIPHAEDDASITADPEELLFRVFPGRRDKSSEDIATVIARMIDLQLLTREDRQLLFPPDALYRYQSYIPADKRRTTKTPTISADQRKTPSLLLLFLLLHLHLKKLKRPLRGMLF